MGKWPVPLNLTGLQHSRSCCYKRKCKYSSRIPSVGLCYIVGTFGNHGWQNDNVVKSCPVPGVDRSAGVGAAGGRVHPQILVNAQNGRGSKCVRHDMLNTTAKIGQLGHEVWILLEKKNCIRKDEKYDNQGEFTI